MQFGMCIMGMHYDGITYWVVLVDLFCLFVFLFSLQGPCPFQCTEIRHHELEKQLHCQKNRFRQPCPVFQGRPSTLVTKTSVVTAAHSQPWIHVPVCLPCACRAFLVLEQLRSQSTFPSWRVKQQCLWTLLCSLRTEIVAHSTAGRSHSPCYKAVCLNCSQRSSLICKPGCKGRYHQAKR